MAAGTPHRFEDITPAWLTFLLRETGALPQGAVTAVALEPVGVGAGFLGQIARLRLTYDRLEAGGPPTLVGKLPTLDPGGREICRLFRFYEREIRFYRELTRRVPIPVPHCYASIMDVVADDYFILLEDLGSLPMGDDASGCSIPEAERAIRSVAELHAAWWASSDLDQLDWIPVINAPVHQMAEPAYQQALPHFLKLFGDRLSPELRGVTENMPTHIVGLQNMLTRTPMTIGHGDYRLDNLFFGTNGVATIDWQIVFRGRGAFDVAYFLSGCLTPAVRRAEEMRLLRLWYELATGGRPVYTFDDAVLDYRRSVLYCHVYTVIATGSLNPTNDRGMAVFQAWLERRGAAIEELDAGELMPA
jgi:ecdysteroid kinase